MAVGVYRKSAIHHDLFLDELLMDLKILVVCHLCAKVKVFDV